MEGESSRPEPRTYSTFAIAKACPTNMRLPMMLGVAVSAVVGCIAISMFLRFLRGNSLSGFVIYRVLFGLFVLFMAFFRG